MQFALIALRLLLMFIKSREQQLHDNDVLAEAYRDVIAELEGIRLRAMAARLAARKRVLDAAMDADRDGGGSESDSIRDPFRID